MTLRNSVLSEEKTQSSADAIMLMDTQSAAAYRPEIDGLRALAVTAVIVNHFNKDVLPSGHLGVDIFFVISGFVITSSLAGRTSQNFGDFLAEFYVRRIKRIIPPLLACVVLTSILICLFNPGPGVSLRTGTSAVFGLSNIYLLRESTDYFATASEINVFTHTWSLGVEEQFYLIFPLLLWWAGFGRASVRRPSRMLWVIGALSLVSLASFSFLYQTSQAIAYFSMPTRFWELATGSLLFVGMRNFTHRLSILVAIPAATIAVLLVCVLFIPATFAVPATISVVTLTALLIARLSLPNGALWIFHEKWVIRIGLISYSLYLWHWVVLSLSRWTIGIHWWTVPFQVAAMLLLAIASYRYIETPLRRAEWSRSRSRTITFGLSAAIFSAAMIGFVFIARGYLYAGKYYLGPSLHQENMISGTSINQTNCMLTGDKSFSQSSYETCRLPSTGDKPMIFFVGSSHAMHLAGLGQGLHERGYGVSFMTMQGQNFYPETGPGSEDVDFVSSQSRAILSRLQAQAVPGSILVIANRYYQSQYESTFGDSYFQGLTALARIFEQRGVKLVLFLPLPEYEFHDINQCAPQWFNAGMRNSGICTPKDPLVRQRQSRDVERRSLNAENLIHYDATKTLCAAGISTCYPVDPTSKQPTFRNPDHLSNYGASLLVDDFLEVMSRNGLVRH